MVWWYSDRGSLNQASRQKSRTPSSKGDLFSVEHPDAPHAPASILMTRVPGEELGRVYEALSDEERKSIFQDLESYLKIIRGWSNP